MMHTTPASTLDGGTMPTKPDGSPWTHAMVYQEGDTLTLAMADQAGELLSLVIDDYPREVETEDDLAELDAVRIDYGIRLAQGVQESWLASAVQSGELDLAVVDERVVDAWFRAKDTGVDVSSLPGDGDQWTQEVPLVCLDMAYAPFTEIPAPGGNVAWVRVRTETDLLASMGKLGLVARLNPAAGTC